MRTLIIRGNPRPIGYTRQMTDLVVQGLREVHAQVKDVTLSDLTLLPCRGCYHCWQITPGQCVHGDDMGPLLEEVRRAEVMIWTTPVYYFSMSALLKTFIERCFPLYAHGQGVTRRGRTRNRLRYPEEWQNKKLITLLVGALRDPAAYQPALDTFEWIADSFDFELGGQLVRPESYLADYPLSKPKTIKRIRTAFLQAGREAGTTGRLSPETLANASLPVSPDEQHFRDYSEIYWTHALPLGDEGLVPSKVQKHVAYDVRILMREMVRAFDPRAAAHPNVTVQFLFPDRQLAFVVRVDHGQCALEEATDPNPDLTVRCDARTWASLFVDRVDVRELLKNHRITLEGDKSLFRRLERWFPPPSA